ncbi:hypothetical protein ACFX2I_023986 [Malus domestica]
MEGCLMRCSPESPQTSHCVLFLHVRPSLLSSPHRKLIGFWVGCFAFFLSVKGGWICEFSGMPISSNQIE